MYFFIKVWNVYEFYSKYKWLLRDKLSEKQIRYRLKLNFVILFRFYALK